MAKPRTEGEGLAWVICACWLAWGAEEGLLVLVEVNLPVNKKYPTAKADSTNPIVINLSHLGSSISGQFYHGILNQSSLMGF